MPVRRESLLLKMIYECAGSWLSIDLFQRLIGRNRIATQQEAGVTHQADRRPRGDGCVHPERAQVLMGQIGADDIAQIALAILDGVADRDNDHLAHDANEWLPDSGRFSLFQFFNEIDE